jgi:pseudomonalisin
MLSFNNAKCRWFFCAIILAAFTSGTPVAQAAPHPDFLNSTTPKIRVTAQVEDNDRVTLPESRHPATMDATDLGRADDMLRLDRMILSLKPDLAQDSALENFLHEVQDPASASYRQWLTPQSFEQHFGVAVKDIDTIKKWLTDNGFTIDELPVGGRTIIFSGSAADIRRTFKTEIHRYKRNGEEHIANASEVQIPRALDNVVNGVVSLHDFRSQPMHALTKVSPSYTANATTHYLAPADFALIYNLNPLYMQAAPIQGNGRSVAILGRTNVTISDITTFRSKMNLPVNSPQIILNGADPGYVAGDETESDLDIEWAGAIAPAAAIKLVTTASTVTTDGIDGSASYAISNNVADVISLSYGACEKSLGSAGRTYYNNLWQQAAAQGITVLVSSGDSGSADCDSSAATTAVGGATVNGLCASPYSTCVGGTQFSDTTSPSQYWASTTIPTDQSSALSYIPEVVWNESGVNGGAGLWASGGGASKYVSKPSWQAVSGVPADSKRDVPDVAMTAAMHDGYLIYTSDNATRTQQLMVTGGTSAPTPSFAGIMALVNQKTGSRQGNANLKLYGLAAIQATEGIRTYFHNITSGNNSVPGQTGFAANTASYNQATGLGSMDGNVLVMHWMDSVSIVAVNSTSPSIAAGQGVTFTATVTGTSPTGTVQFMDGASNLSSPVNVSAGVANLSTNLLVAAGTHSITAVYSGDSNNAPSISATIVQTVTKASSSSGLTSSASSISLGQSVTFTATVTGASPTGTVQFMDGVMNLDVPVSLSSGVAVLTTAVLAQGSHSITAAYTGDANNLGSTSNAITQTVTAAVVVNSGGDSSDVPTLPEWGVILLAMLLMLAMWKTGARGI